MKRHASVVISALLALTLTGAADAAQRSRQKAEPPPPPPPQFKVDGPTRAMSIERFGIAIPVGSTIGTFTRGCLGFMDGATTTLYSDNAFRNVPQQDFMNEFTAEAA